MKLLPAVLLLVPFAASAWSECKFSEERRLDLDAAGLERLQLEVRAGDLDVRGEPGLKRIEVRGRACASDAETLAQIQLREHRDGAAAGIKVEMPPMDDDRWFQDHYATLDVDVRVPQSLLLSVADSSGDASIRGANLERVHDSSGDLEIEDARGPLRITDSSGDIDVRGARAAVTIDVDSSGDIDVEQVAGDVTIATDSSGGIELKRIDGSARVERDSSGDIRFDGIARDAFVGTDSSGSIVANDVGGDFTVRRDGSGSIDHRNVRGKVDVVD